MLKSTASLLPDLKPLLCRKAQYKDVCRKTIENLQSDSIFKVNCYLKVHNARLKLATPILGEGSD